MCTLKVLNLNSSINGTIVGIVWRFILAFFHGGGVPPRGSLSPWKLSSLPEIWSENNSITKEICITIDFALLKKIPGRKPVSLTKVKQCSLDVIYMINSFEFQETNVSFSLIASSSTVENFRKQQP